MTSPRLSTSSQESDPSIRPLPGSGSGLAPTPGLCNCLWTCRVLSGGSLALGMGSGARASRACPVSTIPGLTASEAPPAWAGVAGEPGTVPLSFCSAFSWPWWDSPDCKLSGSPSPRLVWIRFPTCQHRAGLSQAPPRRKLIRFPRKDAEREGQIELAVPGIQALQQAGSSCKARPPPAEAASRGPAGKPSPFPEPVTTA